MQEWLVASKTTSEIVTDGSIHSSIKYNLVSK